MFTFLKSPRLQNKRSLQKRDHVKEPDGADSCSWSSAFVQSKLTGVAKSLNLEIMTPHLIKC